MASMFEHTILAVIRVFRVGLVLNTVRKWPIDYDAIATPGTELIASRISSDSYLVEALS